MVARSAAAAPPKPKIFAECAILFLTVINCIMRNNYCFTKRESSEMASSIERSAARLRIAVFVVIAVMLSAYVSARMNSGLGATHVEYHPAGGDSGPAHSL